MTLAQPARSVTDYPVDLYRDDFWCIVFRLNPIIIETHIKPRIMPWDVTQQKKLNSITWVTWKT